MKKQAPPSLFPCHSTTNSLQEKLSSELTARDVLSAWSTPDSSARHDLMLLIEEHVSLSTRLKHPTSAERDYVSGKVFDETSAELDLHLGHTNEDTVARFIDQRTHHHMYTTASYARHSSLELVSGAVSKEPLPEEVLGNKEECRLVVVLVATTVVRLQAKKPAVFRCVMNFLAGRSSKLTHYAACAFRDELVVACTERIQHLGGEEHVDAALYVALREIFEERQPSSRRFSNFITCLAAFIEADAFSELLE